MHEFFIVTSGGFYGHYGKGSTLAEAQRAWRSAGGKKRGNAYAEVKFTADLPFAPYTREANEDEADAWVDQMGTLRWVRCEMEYITKIPHPEAKVKK